MVKEELNLPEWFDDSMVKAKVYVGLSSTMLSYMLYRCNIVPTRDEAIPTGAATVTGNGNFIYLNLDFWEKLSDKNRAFLLLHELLHIFLDHISRARDGKYSSMLWNIATDYHINLVCSGAYVKDGKVLYNERYKKYINFIEGGLIDAKWAGMSSDEIYHKLLEENENDPEKACRSVLGDGMEEYESNMIDIIPSDELSDGADEQRTKNRQTAVEAVINAQSSNSVGDNEGELVRKFENLVKPKIMWTEHLSNIIVRNEITWTTYMNYNHLSGEVIFPSYEGNSINVVYGIDTSGSMSYDDVSRAVSELWGLLNTYDSWTVHFITCDVKVKVLGTYSSDEGHTFDDFDLNLAGGGGTRMSPMVEYAKEVSEDDGVNTCIIFTDGYLMQYDLQDDVDFDVVVVITENGNKHYTNDKMEVLFVE